MPVRSATATLEICSRHIYIFARVIQAAHKK